LYYQHKIKNKYLIESFANRLVQMYKHVRTTEWFWFEDYLTYGNSVLPEALLCAYISTENESYKIIARESFGFLLSKIFVHGKIKVILTGNQRTEFHQSYHDMPASSQKDFLNEFLEFGNDNMVATGVKTSDLKNREIPVTIEGDVDLSNTVNTISNDFYVGVDFFPKTLDRFIPDEKRIEGYDLDDIIKFEDEITLTIPADKKFVDKPDNLELKFDGYEFKGEYTLQGNKMVLKKELLLKNGIIKKEDFANWTKFIESIKEFNRYFLSITKK